jgi:ribosomal protein S18 acetylase RimI-like enzyme
LVVSRSTSAILPAVHVRTATVEDALAVETVRIRGWQTAYRGIVADSFLDSLVVDADRRAELICSPEITTLVAVAPDVVGMGAFGPARDGSPAVELYALYVDPAAWRTGVGTSLLAACEGVTMLWVLADNERAQAFYRRHGFVADGGSQVLDLDGPVKEIRMRRG